MKPPKTLDVRDKHDGFTAITRSKTYVKMVHGQNGIREVQSADYSDNGRLPEHMFHSWRKVNRESGTLWCPAGERNTFGTLEEFDERSFYQTNNNVTKAIYKIKGYQFRIAVWFDNVTGERIA